MAKSVVPTFDEIPTAVPAFDEIPAHQESSALTQAASFADAWLDGPMGDPVESARKAGQEAWDMATSTGMSLPDAENTVASGATWRAEIHNALERGGLRTVASGPGTMGSLLQSIVRSPLARMVYPREAQATDFPQAELTADKLKQIARVIYEDASREGIQQKKGGVWGYIANTTFETLPMMALATVAGATTGGAGAFAVAGMVEGESAYQEAIAAGASEDVAQTERILVGTINGVIEQAQINNVLRLGKAASPQLRQIVALARARAWGTLAKVGGQVELKHLMLAANEGVEEALQEMVSIGAATLHGDRIEITDIDRVGYAALGGVTAGYGLTGAASVAQVATRAAQQVNEHQLQVEPYVRQMAAEEEQGRTTEDLRRAFSEAGVPLEDLQKAIEVADIDAEAKAKLAALFGEEESQPETAPAAKQPSQKATAELVEPKLHVGNITERAKEVWAELFTEATGRVLTPEDVSGFTERTGRPTNRAPIPMTTSEAEALLGRMETFLDDMLSRKDRVADEVARIEKELEWLRHGEKKTLTVPTEDGGTRTVTVNERNHQQIENLKREMRELETFTQDELTRMNIAWGDIAALRKALGQEVGKAPFRKVIVKGGKQVTMESAKQRIQEITEGLSVKTLAEADRTKLLREQDALKMAMRKAQKESRQAWSAGRKALREQQRSERAHKEAVNRLKSTMKRIKKKWGRRGDGAAAKMRPELRDAAQSILDAFSLSKPKAETTLKRSDLLDMAKQVEATAADDAAIKATAANLVQKLQSDNAKTFAVRLLDADTLNQITQSLQWIVYQQRWSDRSVASLHRQKYTTINEKILEQMRRNQERRGFVRRAVGAIKEAHANLEILSELASGGEAIYTYEQWRNRQNALTLFVYDVLNRGVDAELRAREQGRVKIAEILADEQLTPEQMRALTEEKHAVVAGGKTVELTTAQIMDIYMHTRNAHNLMALLKNGTRTYSSRFRDPVIVKPTAEELNAIVDVLTPAQRNICERIGTEVLDGVFRNLINDASMKMEGYELALVDNYYSAERYRESTSKGRSYNNQLMLENMGWTKERTGVGASPLALYDFFERLERMDRYISAYHGLAPALRDARTILNNKDLHARMEEAGLLPLLKKMQKQVDRIEGEHLDLTFMQRAARKIMGRGAKGIFSLNPKIAPRQELSYFLVMPYVDRDAFAAGFKVNWKQVRKEIQEESPQLWDRVTHKRFDRDIGTAQELYRPMQFFFGAEAITDKGLSPMRFFDFRAISRLWTVATYETQRAHPNLDVDSTEFRKLRKERAEFLIRRTQPTWHVKDRATLTSTQEPITRAFTMFMSQREKIVMMGMAAHEAWKSGAIDTPQYTRVLSTIVANVALIALYDAAFAALVYRKKKEIKDSFLELMGNLLSLPFFGRHAADLLKGIVGKASGKNFRRQTFETLPAQFIQSVYDGATNIGAGALAAVIDPDAEMQSGPRKGMKKWQAHMQDGTGQLAEAIAMWTGLPYVTVGYAHNALKKWNVIGDEEQEEVDYAW